MQSNPIHYLCSYEFLYTFFNYVQNFCILMSILGNEEVCNRRELVMSLH